MPSTVIVFYILLAVLTIASFITNKVKTILALKLAGKYFIRFLPYMLEMIIFISIILFIIPDTLILKYLNGQSIFKNMLIAGSFGSIIFIPAFIAFPLAALLIKKGVAYMTVAIFTTTLMLVGCVTFPVESKYFGIRLTIIRNAVGLAIAIIISLIIGWVYGEI